MRRFTQEMDDRNKVVAARFDAMDGNITRRVRELSDEFSLSEPMIRVILKKEGRIGR